MSEDELPAGWRWEPFREVARVASNLVDPRLTPAAIHIAPNHIESWTGRLLERGTVFGDDVKSAKHAFHAGQLLYSKIRPYLAKAVLVDFDGLCSADMYPIDVRADRMDAGFLLAWMLTREFTDAASGHQGRTVLPKINQDALNELNVPVPSLDEQRRIVAKLDALRARSRRAKDALDAVPALLDRLRQSILAAAFRGDLTADWREQNPDVEPATELLKRIRIERRKRWEEAELAKMTAKGKPPKDDRWKQKYVEPEPVDESELPELPDGWCWATIEETALLVTDGDHNPPRRVATGVPHLTAKNIKLGQINFEGCSFLTPEGFEQTRARYEPTVGDVIVTCVGTVGEVAVVPADLVFSADRNLAGIRLVRDGLAPQLVGLWLRSPLAQGRMDSGASAQPHLYLGDLRRMPVPVMSPGEQEQLMRVVGELTTRMVTNNDHGVLVSAIAALDSAVLTAAFRGELLDRQSDVAGID